MADNNLFDKWDKTFDTEGLQKDVAEAKENAGQNNYKEVPHGSYEVSVEKMELVAAKTSGNPMLSIWFKIVDGEYKGQFIFMNQVITQGFQIHQANEMLRSLASECTVVPEVEFKTYSQYGNLIMDIHEQIANSFEYALNYSENKKGYNTFEITEVFLLED